MAGAFLGGAEAAGASLAQAQIWLNNWDHAAAVDAAAAVCIGAAVRAGRSVQLTILIRIFIKVLRAGWEMKIFSRVPNLEVFAWPKRLLSQQKAWFLEVF